MPKQKRRQQLRAGDHVVGNAKYVDTIGVAHEAVLIRPQPWREGLWLATMHHPVLGTKPHLVHESVLEKFEEEHVGTQTSETVKMAGFTWTKTNRDQWVADKIDARIKVLDAKTYPVYRDRKYLGSEATLEEAAARAKTNERRPQRAAPPVNAEVTAARARDKVNREVAAKKKSEPRSGKNGERKTELLALLSRGCTREEILRVTGWKAVSVQAMAKSLGVGLRVEDKVKPFKYFSTEEK